MAKIGMKYAVYAPFSGTHTSGTAITYGTGKKLCHAISADVTINRRDFSNHSCTSAAFASSTLRVTN